MQYLAVDEDSWSDAARSVRALRNVQGDRKLGVANRAHLLLQR